MIPERDAESAGQEQNEKEDQLKPIDPGKPKIDRDRGEGEE
jgi:hypothetical protein